MGCDIHCYVEYKPIGCDPLDPLRWWPFCDRINPGRNYTLFGHIAGVRSEGPPVVEPRDVPSDMAWRADQDYWINIDVNGQFPDAEGWCAPHRAQQYAAGGSILAGSYIPTSRTTTTSVGERLTVLLSEEYRGQPTKVSHPDWHHHTWLTVEEFEKAMRASVEGETPESYHPPGVEYWALLAAMKE